MKLKEIMWWQGPTIISCFISIFLYISVTGVQHDSPVITESNMESTILHIKSVAVEEINVDFSNSQNDSVARAFGDTIQGTYFVDENIMFDFGRGSSYYGFFDNENLYVQNYTYRIVMKNSIPYIYILSPDESQMVSYKFIVKNEKKSLLYEPNDLLIELE